MATAGSGDVLSGILAGGFWCAFRSDPENTVELAKQAAFGVFLHGLAGDKAVEEKRHLRNESRRHCAGSGESS